MQCSVGKQLRQQFGKRGALERRASRRAVRTRLASPAGIPPLRPPRVRTLSPLRSAPILSDSSDSAGALLFCLLSPLCVARRLSTRLDSTRSPQQLESKQQRRQQRRQWQWQCAVGGSSRVALQSMPQLRSARGHNLTPATTSRSTATLNTTRARPPARPPANQSAPLRCRRAFWWVSLRSILEEHSTREPIVIRCVCVPRQCLTSGTHSASDPLFVHSQLSHTVHIVYKSSYIVSLRVRTVPYSYYSIRLLARYSYKCVNKFFSIECVQSLRL